MAVGAFDDLPGAGKPLANNENPFEMMSADALAHRVLKNAGCAPGWVEMGKQIRQSLLNARANLALGWATCVPRGDMPRGDMPHGDNVPSWPLPEEEEERSEAGGKQAGEQPPGEQPPGGRRSKLPPAKHADGG